NETLGGGATHSSISGVTDYLMKDDRECIETIRSLVSHLGRPKHAGFARTESTEPSRSIDELRAAVPPDRSQPYDMMRVIEGLIDAGSWTPYKSNYGKTILCGYARIDGWSVGIVANQRLVVRSAQREMQVGGVIYSDSADKAARFIMNCNQKKVPLLFLQDVTGFMVGTRAEHGGIIKDGAKMVNAVANSVVPKFTVIVGNSYGAGNYAMCGRAYDPRLIWAWPTARIAVMGGSQAAKTLLQIQVAKLERSGKTLSKNEKTDLLHEIETRYEAQTDPLYAAARLWVDEIIDPINTRRWISTGIEMADHNDEEKEFSTGVIQT
ncbi:MAG TPA: carboxyl transferase domain-containing protein, partial [Rhodothermia bacterium]|nr:carboxyl transferase domain-containing protein [Rhodothermia bacterium]